MVKGKQNYQISNAFRNIKICSSELILMVTLYVAQSYAQNLAFGPTNTLPAELQAQLERQTAALKAFSVEYDEMPWSPKEGNFMVRSHAVTFDGPRFYQSSHTTPTRAEIKMINLDSENAFDGQFVYSGSPSDPSLKRPGTLIKYLPSDSTDPARLNTLFLFPYLDEAGFYVPMYLHEFGQFSGIEPLILHYLKESESTQITTVGADIQVSVRVKDVSVAIVRQITPKDVQEQMGTGTQAYQELARVKRFQAMEPRRNVTFLLDPQVGFNAIKREEFTADGKLIRRIECRDWKYYASADVWLPGLCTVSNYTNPHNLDTFSDEPISASEERLKNVRFGSQDVVFSLDRHPSYLGAGTMIADRSLPEARLRISHTVGFVLAGDGKLLRASSASAMSEMQERHSRFSIVTAIIILLFMPFIFLWIFRKKSTIE
jgi:hypothetical protein